MTRNTLPENPSLELDRKRAKQLLAAAQAHDAQALERFASHHPRFERMAPDEICTQVKLHHAQLVIAREYGFSSWPRLKAHIEACRLSERERAELLVRSACSSELRTARALLAREPELARRDVFTACVCGEPERLRRALAHDRTLARRAGGPRDCEPIVYACFSRFLRGDAQRAQGIVECVRLLLSHGADPNAHDFEGAEQARERQTCLYAAAGIANNAELTAMLLSAGADVNELDPEPQPGQYKGMEALYHAAEFRDVRCLQLLLAAKPYPACVSYCLGRALDHDNEAAALLFLEHGADPNLRVPWADNRSHMHKAAMWGRSEATLRAMLARGGDCNALDARGLSPYRLAARFGHAALVALFEAHGADRSALSREDLACGVLSSGRKLQGPVDVVPDADLLRRAVHCGDLAAAAALLDAGADIELGRDMPPLHEAAYWGQADMVALLLQRGARTDSLNSYGGTALGAVQFGSSHCVDPNGGVGTKLPEEIAHGDYPRVAELLIAAGVPLPDEVTGSEAVAEVLRRHGVGDTAS